MGLFMSKNEFHVKSKYDILNRRLKSVRDIYIRNNGYNPNIPHEDIDGEYCETYMLYHNLYAPDKTPFYSRL